MHTHKDRKHPACLAGLITATWTATAAVLPLATPPPGDHADTESATNGYENWLADYIGVYCFPLEYFTKYRVRTYPKAVPLSFEYDDGCRPDPYDDGSWGSFASAPQASLAGADPEPEYEIDIFPQVYIRPNALTHDQAIGEQIEVFCKAKNITSHNYMTLWGQIVLNFIGPSQAVIGETETAAPTKPPPPATSGER